MVFIITCILPRTKDVKPKNWRRVFTRAWKTSGNCERMIIIPKPSPNAPSIFIMAFKKGFFMDVRQHPWANSQFPLPIKLSIKIKSSREGSPVF